MSAPEATRTARGAKRVTITIPRAMYERFKHERGGYGALTVGNVIERKLRFWEGRWEDDQ